MWGCFYPARARRQRRRRVAFGFSPTAFCSPPTPTWWGYPLPLFLASFCAPLSPHLCGSAFWPALRRVRASAPHGTHTHTHHRGIDRFSLPPTTPCPPKLTARADKITAINTAWRADQPYFPLFSWSGTQHNARPICLPTRRETERERQSGKPDSMVASE